MNYKFTMSYDTPNSWLIGMKISRESAIAILMLLVVVTACAPGAVKIREGFVPRSGARILLMTPDIELSELTAGGLNEPNAAWTEAAKTHVTTAIDNALAQRGASLVVHQDVAAEPATAGQIERMLRLHEAVGQSILLQYNPQLALPTKKDDFDWTLGEQISFLKDDSNADYALFVFLRDSFASAGRVGVMIGAAILGIGLPGGVQYGFASLVDLRSGDIVWFNQFGNTTGDLRNGEDAATAITTLLSGLPL